MLDVQRDTLDGVPVFWGETSSPEFQAALIFRVVYADVLWLMVAAILTLGGIVLSGSNSRTADEFAAGIAEAERLRAVLIGEIDLTLVPEPTRLLH